MGRNISEFLRRGITMNLTPWNKNDFKELLRTLRRVVEMVIGGAFAGLAINPLNLTLDVFFGLLLAVLSSVILVYLTGRMK